jgi:hypothetical protein
VGKASERFRAILKSVAADLKVTTDSDLCRHVATLRLARENMQHKLLLGERVDIKDLLDLDAALKRHLPERDPMQINVKIVSGTKLICPHCGKMGRFPDEKPSVEAPPSETKNAPAAVSVALEGVAKDAPAPSKPATPTVKVTYREGFRLQTFIRKSSTVSRLRSKNISRVRTPSVARPLCPKDETLMSEDSERIAHLRTVLADIERKQAATRDPIEDADLGRRAIRVAHEIIRLGGGPSR